MRILLAIALLLPQAAFAASSSIRISQLIDFEDGRLGTDIEVDTNSLNRMVKGASPGGWSTNIIGGSGHITLSSDQEQPFLRAISLTNSGTYMDTMNWRCFKQDDVCKNEYLKYFLAATAAKVSWGFYFYGNSWTSDDLVYDLVAMENTAGSDFLSCAITNRSAGFDVFARTAAGASTHIRLTKAKVYWICMKYDAAGLTGTIKVYDPVTWLVVGTVTKAIANSNAKFLALGRYDNNQNAPASSVHYLDDVVIDDTGNNYPIFPASAWVADTNAKADYDTVFTSSSSGDQIVLPSGSNTWTATATVNKSVTISGVSLMTCLITNNSAAGSDGANFDATASSVTFSNIAFSGTNYGFTAGGRWGHGIDFDTGNYGRVRNCFFERLRVGVICQQPGMIVWGSKWTNCQYMVRVFGNGDGTANWNAYGPASAYDFGNTNQVVVEDCIYAITSAVVNDTVAMLTSQQGQMWCFRSNYVDINANYDYSPMFDTHGPTSGGPLRGGIGVIIAHNWFDFRGAGSSADPWFDWRGGAALVWNNVITNYTAGAGAQIRVHDGDAGLYDQNGANEHHTNGFIYLNVMNTGALPVTTNVTYTQATNCNRLTTNVNYFGVAPADSSQIHPGRQFEPPYPHPLRDDRPPRTIITLR